MGLVKIKENLHRPRSLRTAVDRPNSSATRLIPNIFSLFEVKVQVAWTGVMKGCLATDTLDEVYV